MYIFVVAVLVTIVAIGAIIKRRGRHRKELVSEYDVYYMLLRRVMESEWLGKTYIYIEVNNIIRDCIYYDIGYWPDDKFLRQMVKWTLIMVKQKYQGSLY